MNDIFLNLIRSSTQKRIDLEKIRLLWAKAHPELHHHPNRDALIMAELKRLADKEEISLPAPRSFERYGEPPMPKFVTINISPKPQLTEQYENISWMPQLHFWPQLKRNELETLKPINDWLIRRMGRFTQVPLRERSLEIFGDEKHLDPRVRDNALFSGRLPLHAIGAFLVPHPLPYRAADAPGKPLLVVENHHTYWSIAEWNTKTRQYTAVVYGSGNAFASSQQALLQIQQQCRASGLLYFGDIDPTGIIIPLRFNSSGNNPVHPATDLYKFILDNGKKTPGLNRIPEDEQHLKRWLPQFSDLILDIWSGGHRIPQENLGTEQLISEFSKNPPGAALYKTRQT